MEQKATIDAMFAMALGLHAYVNSVPAVTGAPNLVELLPQDSPEVTSGILNVYKNPVQAVDAMLKHIEAKRKNGHMDPECALPVPFL